MGLQAGEPGSLIDWKERAATLDFRTSPFIDGHFVESRDAGRFETINPATLTTICELPAGCDADVDAAVAAARRAFEDGRWHRQPPGARRAVMMRLADLIEAHGDELALLDSLEMGKAISSARSEIAMSSSSLRYFAEAVDKLYGAVAPSGPETIGLTLYEPRGVVGAIVPWNFPLANSVVKVAPALAAGNSIVLKPSEIASLSALRLGELAVEAGLPAGVLNVVPGLGPTVGRAIAAHPDIDFLTFTGSTRTGRRLMEYAGASNGKPLMLELGGKSAQIVCADMADEIDLLAARIVRDAFWNQGQWCSARSRLIVEQRFEDRLLEAISTAARRLVPGDPLDPVTNFGTIATRGQFDQVEKFIAAGRGEGAAVVLDGASGSPCPLSMAPTIFAGTRPDMTIVQEEIFGPVLSTMTFSDFEQAIVLANQTSYGLGASVWTRDSRQAQSAARALRAGKVLIRATAARTGSSGAALGGEPWGASGFGAEKGMDGLRAYCRVKAVEFVH